MRHEPRDGVTAAGGFYSVSHSVMLKSAIGALNLSGLTAADSGFTGFFLQPYHGFGVPDYGRPLEFGYFLIPDAADVAATLGQDGRLPALWVEVRDESTIPSYHPGIVESIGGLDERRWSARAGSDLAESGRCSGFCAIGIRSRSRSGSTSRSR